MDIMYLTRRVVTELHVTNYFEGILFILLNTQIHLTISEFLTSNKIGTQNKK